MPNVQVQVLLAFRLFPDSDPGVRVTSRHILVSRPWFVALISWFRVADYVQGTLHRGESLSSKSRSPQHKHFLSMHVSRLGVCNVCKTLHDGTRKTIIIAPRYTKIPNVDQHFLAEKHSHRLLGIPLACVIGKLTRQFFSSRAPTISRQWLSGNKCQARKEER